MLPSLGLVQAAAKATEVVAAVVVALALILPQAKMPGALLLLLLQWVWVAFLLYLWLLPPARVDVVVLEVVGSSVRVVQTGHGNGLAQET